MADSERPGFWKRFGPVFEAWVVFGVSAAIMIQILIWSRPFTDTILPRWIASYTSWALALVGAEGEARGTVVHSSIGSAQIIRECTAAYPTALYLAAVFAFRCNWRKKLIGVFGGILALQFVNLIRIVSLMYVQRLYPEKFEFAHMIVWQSLIVFIAAVMWLLWSSIDFSWPRPRDA